MKKKIVYTLPNGDTRETPELLLGLSLHEADKNSQSPGGLFGSLAIRDQKGEVVFSIELNPADFKSLESEIQVIKKKALGRIKYSEVEAPETEVKPNL